MAERNTLVTRKVANPCLWVEAEASGTLPPRQGARCSRAFKKPPWKAGPASSAELSHVRPRKPSEFVINTLGRERSAAEGTDHATVKRSPPPLDSP